MSNHHIRFHLNEPLILLCGGQASRMGTPKGLLPYQGHTWLEEQIARFAAVGGQRVFVVLGFSHEKHVEELSWLKTALKQTVAHAGIQVSAVINETPELGPFSSIQSGARAVLRADLVATVQTLSVFILPIDVPAASQNVWESLSIAMAPEFAVCVPQWQANRGHPVLLSRDYLEVLLRVDPRSEKARLDEQIRLLPDGKVCAVAVDDSCIRTNLNTPEDWSKFSVS